MSIATVHHLQRLCIAKLPELHRAVVADVAEVFAVIAPFDTVDCPLSTVSELDIAAILNLGRFRCSTF